MVDITIKDAKTGKVVERDFTPDELAQRETDQVAAAQRETEAATAKAVRRATITAARDFALSLGFTTEMLDVMYPQLTEGA